MTRHDMTPQPVTTTSGRVLDIDWTGSTVITHTEAVPSPRPVLSLTQSLHSVQCPCGWRHITHDDPGPAARDHAATHGGDVYRIEWRAGEIVAEWHDDDPTQGHTFGSLDACPACPHDDEPWSALIHGRHIDLMADGHLHAHEAAPAIEPELDLFTAAGVTA